MQAQGKWHMPETGPQQKSGDHKSAHLKQMTRLKAECSSSPSCI